MDSNKKAIRDYPSKEISPQNLLHIYHEDGEWHVWLNVDAEFTGLCLAVHEDYDTAVGQAVETLEAATEAMQGPRWFPQPNT